MRHFGRRFVDRRFVMCWLVGILIALLLPQQAAHAHETVPHSSAVKELVSFDQRLDAQVPVDLRFQDEQGAQVTVGHYLGKRPVILALSYFECETLCPLVRQGLVEALRPLAFTAGDEFEVLLVSVDPEETAATAAAVKAESIATYGRAGSVDGWHFLTGDHDTIDALAEAIGFHYAYDAELDEYAHPSGVVVLTPEGRVARYFFGIEYVPQDLRLGLVEAAQFRIGNAVDQLLLMCYHYDPTTGKYSLMIMNVLRGAGVLTVALMGLMIGILRRRERNEPPPAGAIH